MIENLAPRNTLTADFFTVTTIMTRNAYDMMMTRFYASSKHMSYDSVAAHKTHTHAPSA